MRIAAYVLAADPAWIEQSVASYYDVVEDIVVSYDPSGRGWTGASVPLEECLARLAAIDRDGKMRHAPGNYARGAATPMACETAQRKAALAEAGAADADWVLQIDTDEVLPDSAALLEVLEYADEHKLGAVEWPMRVLFRTLPDGRILEVCTRDRQERFEYPGPVVVRPNAELIEARRARGPFLRPLVRGDDRSVQVLNVPEESETRAELLTSPQAILHYSWAGSPARIRTKIAAWGHSSGLRSWAFYYLRWRPAPYVWRTMRNFHPFAADLWPALKISDAASED